MPLGNSDSLDRGVFSIYSKRNTAQYHRVTHPPSHYTETEISADGEHQSSQTLKQHNVHQCMNMYPNTVLYHYHEYHCHAMLLKYHLLPSLFTIVPTEKLNKSPNGNIYKLNKINLTKSLIKISYIRINKQKLI